MISSINKTSPSFNPRSNPKISLGLSIAGAVVILILIFISLAIKKPGSLTKPGCPYKRECPKVFFAIAASIAILKKTLVVLDQ